MSIKIREALTQASLSLREAGIESARLDAEVLLAHTLHKDRLFLYLHGESSLSPREAGVFQMAVERRRRGEPVFYITREKEFYGHRFYVDQRVLIPRPETELLVEMIVEWVRKTLSQKPVRILEHGVGSGAVITSLVLALPCARAWGTEISKGSLAVARHNLERHQVTGRVTLLSGDFWQACPRELLFDVVVSNPPYVDRQAMGNLPDDVRLFEPKVALDGGEGGIAAYRAIIKGLPSRLAAPGLLALEFGLGQWPALQKMVRETGLFSHVQLRRDYSGRERYLFASR